MHPTTLEVELERKLNDARPRADGCYPSERCRADRIPRVCIVHPVENIKELSPELAPESFGERKHLDERDIDVLLSWPEEEVARGISEGRSGIKSRIRNRPGADLTYAELARRHKCRRVEELIQPIRHGARRIKIAVRKRRIEVRPLNS